MLDYKLLEALSAVLHHQGFERAARHLGLTQSAVSQRIKLLEARLGQPVLVRGNVPEATDLGRRLLNHVQQVQLLEEELTTSLPQLAGTERHLRVAINADSISTWWPEAMGTFMRDHPMTLDLVIEDQDVGLQRMRHGEVAACLCASAQPVQGTRVVPLGKMRYRSLAHPEFLQRHLPDGPTAKDLARSPAIVFDLNDQLQHRCLAEFGIVGPFPHHFCASTEGFIQLVRAGIGWGMMPELQVANLIETGELVDLVSGYYLDVPLYWHYWRLGGESLDALARHLEREARRVLVQGDV